MRAILIALCACLPLLGCIAETTTAGAPGPQAPAAELAVTFVSGHLGNYWDCPDEALALPGGADRQAGPGAGAPAEAGAPEFADCAEDGCGGGLLNCDQAMVIVQVENVGAHDIAALSARHLVVMLAPAVEAEVLSVTDVETGAPAGGLAAGEQVQLRVTFRGPPNGAVDWDASVPVQVEIVGDADTEGEGAAALQTPPLAGVPAVAT